MIPKELEEILLKVQKPGKYIGGETGSVIKDKSKIKSRIAFCFPDLYEVGMSHLGMKILYGCYNENEDMWCERVFAPDADMEALMRQRKIPLYALESFDPICNFDFIAFTLQFELSFTTVLNMLDLAGVPVRARDRKGLSPIVIGGGPCVCNPEPMADFFDIFILGEGEEVNVELSRLHIKAKDEGWSKEKFLREASKMEGIYVPSLYDVSYNSDGTVRSVAPNCPEAPERVTKAIIKDMSKAYYPTEFVVPFVEPIHDRAMLEVLRGCIRGCRFCQAGFIYRPFREKSKEVLAKTAREICSSTGYEEISLTSLSTSDYSDIEPLLDDILPWAEKNNTNISLPSLRVDNFSKELLDKISGVRKSGLTFAPEAGTQRLRDVINKNVTEGEIIRTMTTAFEGGYTSVKLYFMMGLPTETDEDIVGIAKTAQMVVDLFYNNPNRPKGKGVQVSISCACFVPKPHTPFEFEPQDDASSLKRKQQLLLDSVTSKKIKVSYHDADVSFLEGVLARGDRRLCSVIEDAWKMGANLDGWSEHLKIDAWREALSKNGLDPSFYANRKREFSELMPWDHLDFGVSKEFLIRQDKLAYENKTSPNCRENCSGCGANKLIGGRCFD